MQKYIAFLRAINVGGHTVKMAYLKELFESLGFADIETFIASGNVIFNDKSAKEAELESKIEKLLKQELGYEVTTFLRSISEVAAIVSAKPFGASLMKTSTAFNVGFLKKPLSSKAVRALLSLKTDIDDFATKGREIYWLCKLKQSQSTFSNVVFEKAVGIRATLRGMNTISRLAAKYGA